MKTRVYNPSHKIFVHIILLYITFFQSSPEAMFLSMFERERNIDVRNIAYLMRPDRR